jgi:hypothetical protein
LVVNSLKHILSPRFGLVQQTSYGAILDTWTNIGDGTSIADLLSGTNNLSNPPNMIRHLVDRLESPSNVCDSCGSRMKGWLVPPVTGNYEFWIASDDNGEFFLSTDNINLQRLCHVPGFTSPREWTKYPEQKSSPIRLNAGQAYEYLVRIPVLSKHHVILGSYICSTFLMLSAALSHLSSHKALMKEGVVGDHLAIAWQYPGQSREVIPASYSLVENVESQTPFPLVQ